MGESEQVSFQELAEEEAESIEESVEEESEPAQDVEDQDTEEPEGETEGEQVKDQDEPEDETEGEDDGDEEEEPRIPKSRFDEVREQRDELREAVKDKEQLVQRIQNDPETARELLQDWTDRGLIDPSEVPGDVGDFDSGEAPESFQEARERLEQVMPESHVDAMLEGFQMLQQQGQNGQATQQGQNGQQPQQQSFDQQEVQQTLNDLQQTISEMAESDDYEHFEELSTEVVHETAMGMERTAMDKVALDNPETFLVTDQKGQPVTYQDQNNNQVPIYDPDKMDLLYKTAMAETDIVTEQAREEGRDEGKKEVQENLRENAEQSPAEPAGSSTLSGEESDAGKSFKDIAREVVE